jgi:hypothetical protein
MTAHANYYNKKRDREIMGRRDWFSQAKSLYPHFSQSLSATFYKIVADFTLLLS